MTAVRTGEAPPVDPPTDEPPEEGDGDGNTKITVWMTPRSIAALEIVMRSRGVHMTDAMNLSAQVAGHFEELDLADAEIYVRQKGSDELVRLRFL